MHAAAAPQWLAWLEASSLAATMRQSIYLYPAVNVLHVLGAILLVGPIVMLDLRLLGVSRGLPMTTLARHLLPVAVGAFVVLATTGTLQFLTEATAIARNPVFQVKLVLIGLGLANAAAFHLGPWRGVAAGATSALSGAGRAGALASLSIWLAVAACGRLIAYF